MKKSLEEIKNIINKVIDKKRLDNLPDDANSLKKNLDFFLKGFESSVDNSWSWIYIYNPKMIHNDLYRSGDKGDLRFNELLHEGDIDVPSEWELFFEEEEKNKEYQDYLNMKSKFEKDDLKQPEMENTKEKEENPFILSVLEENPFILSVLVVVSVLLIIGFLYLLNP